MDYNYIILGGRITTDIQLSYTPNQTAMAKFSMAVNESWTGASGQKQERTCFVPCVAFSKAGETINKYLNKGDPIFITGKLVYETWETEGRKHSRHSVTVRDFQFIGGSKPKTENHAPERKLEKELEKDSMWD